MLQHTATHCPSSVIVLNYTIFWQHTAAHCNALQHTATHCIALQHTAPHFTALQHTAMHCSTKTLHLMPMRLASGKLVERVRNDLHMRRPRHTATRCNTLQQLSLTATPYNKLQRTSTHCNTLQHTATHRNTLQYTLTHCSTQTPHLTPTHCNALQHTATHYTILLLTATHKHSTWRQCTLRLASSSREYVTMYTCGGRGSQLNFFFGRTLYRSFDIPFAYDELAEFAARALYLCILCEYIKPHVNGNEYADSCRFNPRLQIYSLHICQLIRFSLLFGKKNKAHEISFALD